MTAKPVTTSTEQQLRVLPQDKMTGDKTAKTLNNSKPTSTP